MDRARIVTLTALFSAIGFSLACSDLMKEVAEEDLATLAVQVENCTPSEERDTVFFWVRETFVRTRLGQVDIWDSVTFESEVEDALKDGTISRAERVVIAEKIPYDQNETVSVEDRDAGFELFEAMMELSRPQ